MKRRTKPALPIGVLSICLLLGAALAVTLIGCSSDGGTTTSSAVVTSASTSSTTSTSTDVETSTTLPSTLTEYDRELAKTAQIQNRLATYLQEQQAPNDDPRLGVVFGLRARTQALTCRKALSEGDLTLADSAMKDVYSTLNLGLAVATGGVAETLTGARATVASLGPPSDDPEGAAALLDTFISQLAPLLDEAAAIVPATT